MQAYHISVNVWHCICDNVLQRQTLFIFMDQTQKLVDSLIRGLQDKKGRDIMTLNLGNIETAPARYFILCSGGWPQQVETLAESASETARKELKEKPSAVAGLENALWVAIDYGTVMLHIFVPDAREHYDLEHLYEDAEIKEIPNEI